VNGDYRRSAPVQISELSCRPHFTQAASVLMFRHPFGMFTDGKTKASKDSPQHSLLLHATQRHIINEIIWNATIRQALGVRSNNKEISKCLACSHVTERGQRTDIPQQPSSSMNE
jgi:hypothetical protein